MISLLVSDGIKEDTDLLIKSAKDFIAFTGDESLEIIRWNMKKEVSTLFDEVEKLEAAIVDITVSNGIEAARQLRMQYSEIEIMIVASGEISPITYLNPEIRAASLLLKPLQMDMIRPTVDTFLKLFENKNGEDYLFIEQEGEKIRIPYSQIMYFEAKEKKVYARVSNVEYMLYDTIDHLTETLPKNFIRCHRSYIVNVNHIEKIRFSENMIFLADEIIVPVSRSYKQKIKEVTKGE